MVGTNETERMHPFLDGNCRSICMVVVMRECLKLNLYPPIVDDPNQYDGFSQLELFQKALKGMDRTSEIIQVGQMSTPFEQIIMNLKSKPEKKYNARDIKTYIDEIDSFEFTFITDEAELKEPKDPLDSKNIQEARIDLAEKSKQDYLLQSVFLEAWSFVKNKDLFDEISLKQEFDRQLSDLQSRHQRENDVLLAKLHQETEHLSKIENQADYLKFFRSHGDNNLLGEEGVLCDLIRFNCLLTFKQIFKSMTMVPPLYYHLTSFSRTARRQLFVDFLEQEMISTFVLAKTLSESLADIQGNEAFGEKGDQINRYWHFMKEMSSILANQLKDKVSLALNTSKVSASNLKRKAHDIDETNDSDDQTSLDRRSKKARLAT